MPGGLDLTGSDLFSSLFACVGRGLPAMVQLVQFSKLLSVDEIQIRWSMCSKITNMLMLTTLIWYGACIRMESNFLEVRRFQSENGHLVEGRQARK
ncbi:hypothetical protein PAHAL_3G305000 [Panicum hallii]|uniref:Uncharacterized protein n=1 Tax=Panicum hallii TaxID=206008 RepID=A0A2T8KJX5_9POAL|nr:hypothetical protein PAHAL_3G305000 [Panicum hallii]